LADASAPKIPSAIHTGDVGAPAPLAGDGDASGELAGDGDAAELPFAGCVPGGQFGCNHEFHGDTLGVG